MAFSRKIFGPSPDIDDSAVITFFLEKREECDGDQATLELAHADTPFLPTPAEVFEAFKFAAQEVQTRLAQLIAAPSFNKDPDDFLAETDVDAAYEFSTFAAFRHKLIADLYDLSSDEIATEGIPHHKLNLAPDLNALLTRVNNMSNHQHVNLSATEADDIFDGEEPPIFAHRATDTYHGFLAEVLILAKPHSKSLDNESLDEAGRFACLYLPERTKGWINQNRKMRGFAPL